MNAEHTCIKDDGGTPNRRCAACEEEKTQAQPPQESMFDAWKRYEAEVVPEGAGLVQREESRRAFYAGAWASFNQVLNISAVDSDVEAERRLGALGDEIAGILKDLLI